MQLHPYVIYTGFRVTCPTACDFVATSLVEGDVNFPRIACISNYTMGRSASTLSVADG